MKRKGIAVFLAIFLGSWGVHRFYLKQPEIGIIYIALWFWVGTIGILGIPLTALLGWYDAYKYLMMDVTEFDRKFNSGNFRDRYGRKREQVPGQQVRRGKYILMDEDEQTTTQNKNSYFDLYKNRKQSETHKQTGIKKFKDYEIKEAIEEFKMGLSLNPEDKALHFNIACAYSLNENALDAFIHLDKTVALGFSETNRIMTHESLAYVRVLPEFEDFKNNAFRLNSSIVERLKNQKQNLLNELQQYKREKIILEREGPGYLKKNNP
ncbi:MAG: NINE protein [Bacteroidota bacterium]|nr:NINE protein [Bacteroidota bacterium]